MRTQSNARRQAILNVAAQTFHELGYDRTAMCEIRSRVGGSKATLYSYFPWKEERFFAVIAAEVEADVEAIQGAERGAVAAGVICAWARRGAWANAC